MKQVSFFDLNCLVFGKGTIEEILIELQKDESEWSKKTEEILLKMSPTSLKIVFKQIQTGKLLDLKSCLDMEYRIAKQMMKGNDFFEGVRAMLIDKDKNPKWNPSSLDQISNDSIDEYFK